jgi:23S rRNA (cytidine1920-2'-O)/16S rRNA (cytidine1409-2'-O)-methyltransferase
MIAPIRRICNIHIEGVSEGRNRFMKMRLDLLLVQRGIAKSRSQAQDLIKRGAVSLHGKPVFKAGHEVSAEETVEVAPIRQYVARSAHKLVAALDRFSLSPAQRTCLDVGASTGGFTEVLLERGAARVFAVDVGHGQLHESLRADPRVISMEGVDARALKPEDLPSPVEAVACDVSFISLLKVLPHVLPLAARGAWLVALVKPQFEVGRALVGKGGIVKDEAAKRDAAARAAAFIEAAGWTLCGLLPSPIKGQDGNEETLIAARLET